jgi:septal ring factor EnvC (AmiA/AmiB activator)
MPERIKILTSSQLVLTEGSLEVKLPTIWTEEKQSRAEAERRERLEERRSEKRKSQKKEDADARKGRKVVKHCVFPMIFGSGRGGCGASWPDER